MLGLEVQVQMNIIGEVPKNQRGIGFEFEMLGFSRSPSWLSKSRLRFLLLVRMHSR